MVFYDLVVTKNCIFRPPEDLQRYPFASHAPVFRIEPDYFVKCFDRLIVLPCFGKRPCLIIPYRNIRRVGLDYPVKSGNCLIVTAEFAEADTRFTRA
jgi:hypothetical protein